MKLFKTSDRAEMRLSSILCRNEKPSQPETEMRALLLRQEQPHEDNTHKRDDSITSLRRR